MDFHRPVHEGRLERWIGAEKIAQLRNSMRGWYGGPICLRDVPGSVWIHADGSFTGQFYRGAFYSAADALADWLKRLANVRPSYGMAGAGFASVSDVLSRSSQGYRQSRSFSKVGPTGVAGICSSLWRVGPQPAAGTAPGNAPGGTAFDDTVTGALVYANAASGTNHLVGADVGATVASNALLMYDLIFGCNKTMNSVATETVTGVPTRYQSTTNTNADYAGDNFLFIQVGGTALAATAHNNTSILYTDQGGNASTLPSVTGVSGAIVDRLDHGTAAFFHPLESGDVGIQTLTQMQCSATVATGVQWYMMGHPLGFMVFPLIYMMTPFDWITNRDFAPRIFDDACLAFMEMAKPSTASTTYTGRVVIANAAP